MDSKVSVLHISFCLGIVGVQSVQTLAFSQFRIFLYILIMEEFRMKLSPNKTETMTFKGK